MKNSNKLIQPRIVNMSHLKSVACQQQRKTKKQKKTLPKLIEQKHENSKPDTPLL
jgi:hypothetical protein